MCLCLSHRRRLAAGDDSEDSGNEEEDVTSEQLSVTDDEDDSESSDQHDSQPDFGGTDSDIITSDEDNAGEQRASRCRPAQRRQGCSRGPAENRASGATWEVRREGREDNREEDPDQPEDVDSDAKGREEQENYAEQATDETDNKGSGRGAGAGCGKSPDSGHDAGGSSRGDGTKGHLEEPSREHDKQKEVETEEERRDDDHGVQECVSDEAARPASCARAWCNGTAIQEAGPQAEARDDCSAGRHGAGEGEAERRQGDDAAQPRLRVGRQSRRSRTSARRAELSRRTDSEEDGDLGTGLRRERRRTQHEPVRVQDEGHNYRQGVFVRYTVPRSASYLT